MHGFLKKLESGREVVVLNRSKVISRLNQQPKPVKEKKDMTAAERRKWLRDFNDSLERINYVKLDRKYTREEMNQR